MKEKVAKDDEKRVFITSQFVWITGLFVAVLVMFKIIAISHGDANVALALLSSSDSTKIVLGTLVLASGPFLVILWFAFLVSAENASDTWDKALARGFAILALVLIAFVDLPLAAMALALTVVMFWGYRFLPRARKRRKSQDKEMRKFTEKRTLLERQANVGAVDSSLAIELLQTAEENLASSQSALDEVEKKWKRTQAALFFMFAYLFIVNVVPAVMSDRPWMAKQQLVLAAEPPIHGYVAGDEGDRTVVLVDKPRSIKYVDTDDIESQESCDSPVVFGRL